MGCDAAGIHSWAVGIGLPDCIGQEFCNQFGHLPATIAELDNWGSAMGRKTATGWQCLGSSPSPPSTSTLPPTPSNTILPGGDSGTSGIYKFIETNWPLLIGGLGVFWLVNSMGGRRR